MPIFALTTNPHKFAEYRAHLGLYGVSSSLVMVDPSEEDACRAALLVSDDKLNFLFREEADLCDPATLLPIARPYRTPANQGRTVVNTSRLTAVRPVDGVLVSMSCEASIPGHLDFSQEAPDAFNWDDVFHPDGNSVSLYASSLDRGKVSARNIVLDNLVATHLPFRSNRAFKYGKINDSGLVDLNHWPIRAATPVAFDTLPIDVLTENPFFQRACLLDTDVGRMFAAALSEGAHFRAADNRRSWLYWAPGINAGIPLTPKEDPAAELIYLAHDFAHYALPDLLIDTPAGPSDMVLLAHRMIGETLAMVSADMFVMDAFVAGGVSCDATKHGIHPILGYLRAGGAQGRELFVLAVRGAVKALLLGDTSLLATYAPAPVVDRFFETYAKFALADYDWTLQNLAAFHAHQDRQTRWMAALDAQVLADLGLEKASTFVQRLDPGLLGRPFPELLLGVLDVILQTRIHPLMERLDRPDRAEVLSRSIRRYLVGQRALYARYPDVMEGSACLPLLDAVVRGQQDAEGSLAAVRAAFEVDMVRLLASNQITSLDARVYASVFPIVRPHYVSYARPRMPNHKALFDLLK